MSLYHCGGLLVEEPNSPLTWVGCVPPEPPPPLQRAAQDSATLGCLPRGLPLSLRLGWKVGSSSS
ncbi:hypothetical protein FQN60_008729, partial [Etheostoma spectabile]